MLNIRASSGRRGRAPLLVLLSLLLLALAPARAHAGHPAAAPLPPPGSVPDAVVADNAYPYVDLLSATPGATPRRTLKTTMTSVGRRAVADRIIVSFQSGLSAADLADINQQATKLGAGAAKPALQLRNGSYLVDVSGAASVEAAAKAYRAADKRVLAASPDSGVSALTSTQPNDPSANQWFTDIIQAPAAWDRSHGDGVKIAILDSGIQEGHPDLVGKVDDRVNVLWFSSGTDDQDGHGTGVAGIAGAATNNGLGIAGVGFNAHLLNVKVLYNSDGTDQDPEGSASGLATGIYWAVDHGADVINMSLAGSRDCEPWWIESILDTGVAYVRDAIDYAWSHNVVLVAGAGNTGGTGKLFPAACPHVLSVANSNRQDVMTSSSTHGSWVQVAAPGDGLFTTARPGGLSCQHFMTPDGFTVCSGTSMSAPVVSGLAALVLASCGPMSNQAAIDRITGTADPIAGTGVNWQFGRVNAGKAVCLLAPDGLRISDATDTAMTLHWNDRTAFETSFVFSYRRSDGTAFTSNVILPADTTQYTVSGLPTGTLYDFWVKACDAHGCSDPSNVVTARANYFRLHVVVGIGRVTSTPAGINCGASIQGPLTNCTVFFAPGTQVTLHPFSYVDPHTHDEYDFDHWEGACTGDTACTVTMSQSQAVRAVFVKTGNIGQ